VSEASSLGVRSLFSTGKRARRAVSWTGAYALLLAHGPFENGLLNQARRQSSKIVLHSQNCGSRLASIVACSMRDSCSIKDEQRFQFPTSQAAPLLLSSLTMRSSVN
jgi:hypothetical protein